MAEVIVEYEGSIIRAEVIGDLIKCPLCGVFFATKRDLMLHLVSHARGYLDKRVKPPRGGEEPPQHRGLGWNNTLIKTGRHKISPER